MHYLRICNRWLDGERSKEAAAQPKLRPSAEFRLSQSVLPARMQQLADADRCYSWLVRPATRCVSHIHLRFTDYVLCFCGFFFNRLFKESICFLFWHNSVVYTFVSSGPTYIHGSCITRCTEIEGATV